MVVYHDIKWKIMKNHDEQIKDMNWLSKCEGVSSAKSTFFPAATPPDFHSINMDPGKFL